MRIRKRAVYLWGMGILCLFLFGCRKEELIFRGDSGTQEALATEQGDAAVEGDARDGQTEADGQRQSGTVSGSQAGEAAGEEISGEETDGESSEEDGAGQKEYVVHVCGAVVNSGVYRLPQGARIDDALKAAGGFGEDADREYVNLAKPLEDGMKITIPTKEESGEWQRQGMTGLEGRTGGDFGNTGEAGTAGAQENKVNINTADAARLCTLPGIGESRAASIIAYREQNGPFQSPEDIMKVSGIKTAAYEKIKAYITV